MFALAANITATGARAVFMIVHFFSPASLVVEPQTDGTARAFHPVPPPTEGRPRRTMAVLRVVSIGQVFDGLL